MFRGQSVTYARAETIQSCHRHAKDILFKYARGSVRRALTCRHLALQNVQNGCHWAKLCGYSAHRALGNQGADCHRVHRFEFCERLLGGMSEEMTMCALPTENPGCFTSQSAVFQMCAQNFAD